MESYVTDTNALVHVAANRMRRLGAKAKAIFSRFERGDVILYVPAIVGVEIWLLSQAGTVVLESGYEPWWAQFEGPTLIRDDLVWADINTAASLRWSHPDWFDRLVVAAALRLGLPLITADAAISDWGGVDVVW